jgi:ankyrin repeat protein
MTALMYAAKYNQSNNVKYLIKAGANILIKNNKGETAVDIATKVANGIKNNPEEYAELIIRNMSEEDLQKYVEKISTVTYLNKALEKQKYEQINESLDDFNL